MVNRNQQLLMEDSGGGATVPGLFLDGYGLEIQGHKHRKVLDSAATVYLEQGSTYRLRLANANAYRCMVSIMLDGVSIGTFLLNPYSKFDLERPLDRPLGFTFGTLATPPVPSAPNAPPPKPDKRSHIFRDKTVVVATFKPQVGAKIVQIDVSHEKRTHRVELVNDTPVSELFVQLEKELGPITVDHKSGLLHWTCAEYDSPVDDVMKPDMQMHLGVCKRQYEPVRKMSLVTFHTLSIEIMGEFLDMQMQQLATFGEAISHLRDNVPGLATADIYFMSEKGRYICSTLWIKNNSPILQLLHRDEIHPDSSVLSIRADLDPPEDCFSLYARMLTGPSYQLEASPGSTIRECRYQLEELGGPWGDDPRWMFGGTIMESSKALGCYGVSHRVSVDVIPRLYDKGKYRDLQMTDPIAVEGEEKINTAQLIKSAEQRANKQANKQGNKQGRKLQQGCRRGATVLKGRIQQQFVEVDALDVDPRFFLGLSITVLPKELESLDARSTDMSPTSSEPESDRSSCSIS